MVSVLLEAEARSAEASAIDFTLTTILPVHVKFLRQILMLLHPNWTDPIKIRRIKKLDSVYPDKNLATPFLSHCG